MDLTISLSGTGFSTSCQSAKAVLAYYRVREKSGRGTVAGSTNRESDTGTLSAMENRRRDDECRGNLDGKTALAGIRARHQRVA